MPKNGWTNCWTVWLPLSPFWTAWTSNVRHLRIVRSEFFKEKLDRVWRLSKIIRLEKGGFHWPALESTPPVWRDSTSLLLPTWLCWNWRIQREFPTVWMRQIFDRQIFQDSSTSSSVLGTPSNGNQFQLSGNSNLTCKHTSSKERRTTISGIPNSHLKIPPLQVRRHQSATLTWMFM